MKFTDLFIRRPVVATVVNLLILLAGYQAIRSINVRQYPRTDISVITVTTAYYGADDAYPSDPIEKLRVVRVAVSRAVGENAD
jgi:multidrug efflux pump subunit AcrB